MDSLKGSGQEDERNLPPLRVLGDLGAQFLPVVRGPADVQNDNVRTGDLSIGALLSQKREGLYAIADRVDPEGGRKGVERLAYEVPMRQGVFHHQHDIHLPSPAVPAAAAAHQ